MNRETTRKIMCGLILVSVTIGPVLLTSSADLDCRTVNFELGPVDVNSFRNAVFRVEDGKGSDGQPDVGTAFLIDSVNGYLLTAKHVVKNTLRDKSIPIIGTTEAFPGSSFTMEIVDSTPDTKDLALLKMVEPTKISSIQPLDIALRPPQANSDLMSMGYPTTYGNETNTKLRPLPAHVLTISEDGLVEVQQIGIGGGNSGGPLVDSTGVAVAVCREQVGIGLIVARYAPMSDAEPLLNRIPLTPRVSALDSKVVDHSIDEPLLIGSLKRASGNASNVELYVWARHISQAQGNYTKSIKFFECPIIRAMMHRRLDDPVLWLGSLASPKDFAQASLNTSEREASLGNAQAALTAITPALATISNSSDLKSRVRALYVEGISRTKLGERAQGLKLLQEAKDLSRGVNKDPILRADIANATADLLSNPHVQGYPIAQKDRSWAFSQALELYDSAELELAPLGPSQRLAETYKNHGLLLARFLSEYEKAIQRLMLSSRTYEALGDFQGQSEVLYQAAEIADSAARPQIAIEYLQKSLSVDPDGTRALAIKAVLQSAGLKLQDLPGLHHQDNKWVITATQTVPHGDYVYVPNPPCAQSTTRLVQNLDSRMTDFAGPLISQFAGPLQSLTKGQGESSIDRLLGREGGEPSAQCQLVCAVYPTDATIVDVELWAGEQNQPVDQCVLGSDCRIGWSRWLQPINVAGKSSAVMCGIFMNWSHNRDRTASMTISFKPREGWKPPGEK